MKAQCCLNLHLFPPFLLYLFLSSQEKTTTRNGKKEKLWNGIELFLNFQNV